MVNSRRDIKKLVKLKKTPKKYHLLNATKQIYKKNKMLLKKKPMLFAMNGVILKQNIPHYRKIMWIIKNMKTTTMPKVYRVF